VTCANLVIPYLLLNGLSLL